MSSQELNYFKKHKVIAKTVLLASIFDLRVDDFEPAKDTKKYPGRMYLYDEGKIVGYVDSKIALVREANFWLKHDFVIRLFTKIGDIYAIYNNQEELFQFTTASYNFGFNGLLRVKCKNNKYYVSSFMRISSASLKDETDFLSVNMAYTDANLTITKVINDEEEVLSFLKWSKAMGNMPSFRLEHFKRNYNNYDQVKYLTNLAIFEDNVNYLQILEKLHGHDQKYFQLLDEVQKRFNLSIYPNESIPLFNRLANLCFWHDDDSMLLTDASKIDLGFANHPILCRKKDNIK